MKSSRFSEEQIIGILKEQESGMSTADVFCSFLALILHQALDERLRRNDTGSWHHSS